MECQKSDPCQSLPETASPFSWGRPVTYFPPRGGAVAKAAAERVAKKANVAALPTTAA